MKTAIATLESISPYSQSRHHMTPFLDKEGDDDYTKRVWREHCHTNDDGLIVIPPMAFKNCISGVAKYLSMPVPGKNKNTYTKHFVAGVICPEPLTLPVRKADVEGEWLFLPSNGVRGAGKRVMKCYPVIHSWAGNVTFIVLDETVTEEIFAYHLEQAGAFIGIGRFRPLNNGYYGRFKVTALKWS